MNGTVSKYNALKHYIWGEGCDGWNLVDEANFSVKLERMPAGTAEERHYHTIAQQFFYILKGVATFEVDGATFAAKEAEGLLIKAGQKHRILNHGAEDLEFILFSYPSTLNDRIQDHE